MKLFLLKNVSWIPVYVEACSDKTVFFYNWSLFMYLELRNYTVLKPAMFPTVCILKAYEVYIFKLLLFLDKFLGILMRRWWLLVIYTYSVFEYLHLLSIGPFWSPCHKCLQVAAALLYCHSFSKCGHQPSLHCSMQN